MATKLDVSIVVPMHNESDNVSDTLEQISRELRTAGYNFQIVAVDDGSTDDTAKKLYAHSANAEWLQVVSYQPNRGRGYAIRAGIAASSGEIICTIDADLSYSPDHLTRMIALLQKYEKLDCVVGSPYASGGSTEGVPFLRLLISRLGNRVISRAIGGTIKTTTGVLRAYRKDCIKSMELFSSGKELHLEIISKLLAAGYNVIEMPATLRSRKKGKSKFRFRAIAASHLLFSMHEKPMLLFGLIGLGLIGLGLLGGAYVVYLWQSGTLNPDRPLMTLLVLFILTGIQILMFGCARRSSSFNARTRPSR
jgi:dolichol-phosphate mannosyltransferase